MKEHSSPFASSLLVFLHPKLPVSAMCQLGARKLQWCSPNQRTESSRGFSESLYGKVRIWVGRTSRFALVQAGRRSHMSRCHWIWWRPLFMYWNHRRYCIVHSGVLPRKMLMVGSSVMMNPPNHYDHVHAFNHVGAACWMQLQSRLEVCEVQVVQSLSALVVAGTQNVRCLLCSRLVNQSLK